MTPDEATAMGAGLMAEVERLRGQKFKASIPVRVVDDAFTREHLSEILKKQISETALHVQEVAFRQFGLLPAGFDLKKAILDLYEEQAGGYYDPGRRAFFMLDDMPRQIAPVIMAHELTHALDDAHYGLDSLIEGSKDNSDRETALAAVIEGSGTLVMIRYMIEKTRDGTLAPDLLEVLSESEAGRAEKLKAAPPILATSLAAPYILGQNFLLRGDLSRLAHGDFGADIDLAFRNRPASSEQILHPEKYWDEAKRDLPRAVKLPDLSRKVGSGWKLAGSDTLGELILALLSGSKGVDPDSPEAVNPSAWTNEAAAGWGGDRWQVYERGGDAVTILSTVWDTAQDAAEFESAAGPPAGCRMRRSRDRVVMACADPGEPSPDTSNLIDRILGKSVTGGIR